MPSAHPRTLASLALVLLAGSARAQSGIVRGGALFDPVTATVRENPGILYANGRILALGPFDSESGALPDAEVLEVPDGCTVLPGLYDLHAHYAVDLFGKGRVDERAAMPLLFLANGVTSTFTAGEVNPEEMMALRRAIERGERRGPRILSSGPYFGSWRAGWDADVSDEALVREIDSWAQRGVRCFKAKGISPHHLDVLVRTAHRHGIGVTGHLDSGFRGSVNTTDAIALGIDRIEHFLGGPMTPPDRSAYASLVEASAETDAFREIAALFIERGVYYDVTLSAFGYFGKRDSVVFERFHDEVQYFTPHMRALLADRDPRPPVERFERIFQIKHGLLKAFHDAGGAHLITVGTDHPSWGEYLAPFGIHRELHAMVRAGVPPGSALRAATLNAAGAMGEADRYGSVEAGKFADLVIVSGDPTEDITCTRAVWRVVRGGVAHDPAELRAAARGLIGPASAEEEAAWKPRD